MSFTQFKFKKYIEKALEELKFTTPTEVQESWFLLFWQVVTWSVNQKQVQERPIPSCYQFFQQLDEESDSVQAVITAPSRELATQIYQAARQIAEHSDVEIRVANYVGGTDKARQIDKLASNQPHIVIGTPGRIYDLVKSGDLAISQG